LEALIKRDEEGLAARDILIYLLPLSFEKLKTGRPPTETDFIDGVLQRMLAIAQDERDAREQFFEHLKNLYKEAQEALSRRDTTYFEGSRIEDRVNGIVEFLFATDRKRGVSSGPPTFGYERADVLTFGAARVNVPDKHKIGQLELPSEFGLFGFALYREGEDPDRHFIIKSSEVFEQQKFSDIVRSNSSRTALIFVHGFNTTFDQAVLRFAQIVWDLQFKGTSVLFSWPSRGGVLNYLYDRDSTLSSRPHFIELLHILQHEAGIRTVHILAHSMGNMIVLDALNQAAQQFSERPLAELILAAPDVPREAFGGWIAGVRAIARGLTLYASSRDKALVASRAASAGARAGDVSDEGPIVLAGLDSIDVSAIGAEMFGLNHNVFASNRSLIDDIGRIIMTGTRPVHVRSPQIRGMPLRSDPPRYWRYPD
jgi:esterase/lipase superfamily enzyme